MRFNPLKIEAKWQKKWLEEKIYERDLERAKRPFYNLMMFPYPSAEGLHVGNMYAFVGADIYGRFRRMQGYDVFEPIGLDGFGIHSENYALKIGKHPAEQAKISEKNFYRQLEMIGNGFAWEERLETYDPEYYKWTQWIFVQMFKRGLAYRKKAPVNWCPSCKTVLADEQVIQKSKIKNQNAKLQIKIPNETGGQKRIAEEARINVCERCDSKVIKKELEQWFFKITDYAERLWKNLDTIDWPERIKIAQRNWIGRSEGALIKFQITNHKSQTNSKSQIPNSKQHIEVSTTRPDTLFGATYLVLAPEHELISNLKSQISNLKEAEEYIKKAKAKTEEERIAEGKEKTGVELKGIQAVNPATREEIPVWVADYVLGGVGTGAIMAVPAHDQRDHQFAKKFGLSIRSVIAPPGGLIQNSKFKNQNDKAKFKINEHAYEGGGILINSGKFSGMDSEKAKWEITKFVGGERKVIYRLRDWLISRQRYWGPPIPIIYCRKCWENTKHRTQITNKTQNTEHKAKTLRYGIDYTTFDGEEYRIHSVPEEDLPVKLPPLKNFRPTGTDKSPLATVEGFYKVKCPRCGGEARRETDVSDTFLDSAWYYIGYLARENSKFEILNSKFRQRAKRWLPVDMYIGGAEHAVLHLLYVRFLAMAFHDWKFLHFEEPFKKFRAHGLLIKDGTKMSKSRGNVVNPDDYIKAYGADALRMYLMFLGPFEQGGDFRDTGIRGITRFLERVWRFASQKSTKHKIQSTNKAQSPNPKAQTPEQLVHKTIKKVTEDIENLQYNTAISALMTLLNEFEKNSEAVSTEHIRTFLKLLAPFAPFITEELFQPFFGNPKSQIQNPKPIQNSKFKKPKTFRSVHLEPWPRYNLKFLQEESFELVVQVNGKVRGRVTLPMGVSEEEAKKAALVQPSVKQHVSGELRKVIFVPNKLINFVI